MNLYNPIETLNFIAALLLGIPYQPPPVLPVAHQIAVWLGMFIIAAVLMELILRGADKPVKGKS